MQHRHFSSYTTTSMAEHIAHEPPSHARAFIKKRCPCFQQTPVSFLSQRSNSALLPLPPYAFVFSFVLLKRINILEGILSSAFLSFHHLPRRETLIASALLSLEEEQLSVLWFSAFSVKSNHVANTGTCSQSSQS